MDVDSRVAWKGDPVFLLYPDIQPEPTSGRIQLKNCSHRCGIRQPESSGRNLIVTARQPEGCPPLLIQNLRKSKGDIK
jgi:hypothetical protein